MNKKGVTLIELLIVIAIIGILAAIAVPAYIGQQRNAARTEAYSNLDSLRLLEEQYFAENGCYYRTGGPPPVCTDATISGVTNIQAFLPGFRPGSSLNFDYSITTTTSATAFTARATGRSNTRVASDTFWIDNNNNKNF